MFETEPLDDGYLLNNISAQVVYPCRRRVGTLGSL